MPPPSHLSNRQAALAMELAVSRQAMGLAAFGARPTLISDLLGKRLSATEIKRIYKLATTRPTNQGRLPDGKKIMGLCVEDRAALARLLQSHVLTSAHGFDPVDVVLATWRVHHQAHVVNERGQTGLDFELFLTSVRLLNAARIDLRHCTDEHCRAPNVFVDPTTPARCCSCRRKVDPLIATSVRSGEPANVLSQPVELRPRLVRAA